MRVKGSGSQLAVGDRVRLQVGLLVLGDLVVGLAIGSAYSLLAVAVVLVYSGTRVLSLAQGEIGAFTLYAGLYAHVHGFLGYHPSVVDGGGLRRTRWRGAGAGGRAVGDAAPGRPARRSTAWWRRSRWRCSSR